MYGELYTRWSLFVLVGDFFQVFGRYRFIGLGFWHEASGGLAGSLGLWHILVVGLKDASLLLTVSFETPTELYDKYRFTLYIGAIGVCACLHTYARRSGDRVYPRMWTSGRSRKSTTDVDNYILARLWWCTLTGIA